MILAAGVGTRLRPLSLTRPKVLAAVQNRPLLHWLIDYLKGAGAEAVILNAHHLGSLLLEHVAAHAFGIPVQVRVEKDLLGTGGGIRNVEDFWDDQPFVVLNGDILSFVDIQEVLRSHKLSEAWATLVLTDEPRFNTVRVTADGRVSDFAHEQQTSCLAFTGIHILDRRMLEVIPADTPISIIDCYERAIASGRTVRGHVVKGQFWRELGSLDGYMQAHRDLFHMKNAPMPGLQVGGTPVIHPSARRAAGVKLAGMVCIGAGCHLPDGVSIEESILWERVQVHAGCSVRNSIIGDGVAVRESVQDAVLIA
jgi:mannose-1-phosphate guanylyltransferase